MRFGELSIDEDDMAMLRNFFTNDTALYLMAHKSNSLI